MESKAQAIALRQRLRASLRDAIKTRDATAVRALRSAVSAIDNAEAVDAGPTRAGAIPNSRLGVGVGDVARRQLSAHDVIEIVRAEITERLAAAAEYRRLGRKDEADRLGAEAAVLESQLEKGSAAER